jgi:hypothetical protein
VIRTEHGGTRQGRHFKTAARRTAPCGRLRSQVGSVPVPGGKGTEAWLQAELHTSNHGAFNDENGILIVGLNDLDDRRTGHHPFDLRRMATRGLFIMEAHGEGSIRAAIKQISRNQPWMPSRNVRRAMDSSPGIMPDTINHNAVNP